MVCENGISIAKAYLKLNLDKPAKNNNKGSYRWEKEEEKKLTTPPLFPSTPISQTGLVTTDKEKAEVLNNCWSHFLLPVTISTSLRLLGWWAEFQAIVAEGHVQDHLRNLGKHRAMGPTQMHVRGL